MISTFRFGRTVPTTRSADATTIARGIATIAREEQPIYNGMISISENAVHNGSGDLKWINWEARVTEVTYNTAHRIAAYIAMHDIAVGISEDMPDDFDSMGMFTTEGAGKLRQMLAELSDGLISGKIPAQHLNAQLETARQRLSNAGHGEVFDTAVREEIWQELDKVLSSLGVTLHEVS